MTEIIAIDPRIRAGVEETLFRDQMRKELRFEFLAVAVEWLLVDTIITRYADPDVRETICCYLLDVWSERVDRGLQDEISLVKEMEEAGLPPVDLDERKERFYSVLREVAKQVSTLLWEARGELSPLSSVGTFDELVEETLGRRFWGRKSDREGEG